MNIDVNDIKAVAFDLDGTLVDSAPDIAHALNSALGQAGLDVFDLATVREWIGDGPDMLIGRALAAGSAQDADSASLRAELRRDFDAATFAAPLRLGMVYPGMADTLKTLHGTWPMVVVTNKPTALARAVLEAAGLMPLFRTVYGADRAELRKPLPAMLEQAAHDMGVTTRQLLMVGDSAADMNAANAAGAPAALVCWGYGHSQARSLDPWLLVHRPQQLAALLLPNAGSHAPALAIQGEHDAHRR